MFDNFFTKTPDDGHGDYSELSLTIGSYEIKRGLIKDMAALYSKDLTDALRKIMGDKAVVMAYIVVGALPHVLDETVHGIMVKESALWDKVFSSEKDGISIGPDSLAFAVEFAGGNLVYFQASEWFHIELKKPYSS